MRFFLILISFLFARDNPFEPVIKPENQIVKPPVYFQYKKVYFPNDARILKKVIFVYQNLNGEIEKKEVLINKNIDFHKPVILKHTAKEFGLIRMNFFDLFVMYIKNHTIFIKTKDALIRKMFLLNPFRLVLDFRRDADFLTISKIVKNSIVKKVSVGNHNGYYRVVIYFDAKYVFNIKELNNGVKIELR